MNNFIRIRGARTHNLKNISIDIPREKFVVITGVSGSGKSSLAFDTLFAEGQRRYVESLSPYARQFLQQMGKPDVDLIEGLSPAIAIEQRSASQNPRSTVATTTEIHDYLRLLYARVGTPYCPDHHIPMIATTVTEIVDMILSQANEDKIMIYAPIATGITGAQGISDLKSKIAQFVSQGYIRARLNGETYLLESLPPLSENEIYDLQLVVDRLRAKPDNKQRLADSLEMAYELSGGRLIVERDNGKETTAAIYSSNFSCPMCERNIPELEPRLFSFNNPVGACPHCKGLGQLDVFDERKVVSLPSLSINGGAIAGWDMRNSFTRSIMSSLADHYGFSLDIPYEELSAQVREVLLHGSGDENIGFAYLGQNGRTSIQYHPFEGIMPNLLRRWETTDSSNVKEALGKLRTNTVCPSCHGSRLREEARFVMLGDQKREDSESMKGLGIYEIEGLSLVDCLSWFKELKLEGAKGDIATPMLREVVNRLQFLNDVGLSYLSLDRRADTISGGEAQRIKLASQIGSGLSGVMYVLDEPSIGLHQRDNEKLIRTLQNLRDIGNTVIVVEHDEDMIREADWIIDMGPAAGEHGGLVISQGTFDEILADNASVTGQYLGGKVSMISSEARGLDEEQKWLKFTGCRGNNLKNIDVQIPLGRFVCFTGVSGSGKSTLVNETIATTLARKLNRAQAESQPFDEVHGLEFLDNVIVVDQSPIGRTPRSNPATYVGVFIAIRELFASTKDARQRGYDAGRFSFNIKGGRCDVCDGDGIKKVQMHFLPDMYVKCEACDGTRYNRETREIYYRGKNISDVLEMTVEQAAEFFANIPKISNKLSTLVEVGLGYIKLGQSATTLSGGEAQRVKLALELSKRSTGRSVYILDEPTTGLHFSDIDQLLRVLQKFVDSGNTVIVIEHNLDVIKNADWIIDLGPEGGNGGGQIIAFGTPKDIAKHPKSETGKYLAKLI
ncbi:excinuclease ABC subunit UvrA [Taylorella asinigenitalis]|uniref:UvrABC system protein A n=1 Tax=Taylorella asinigenitalis (strain MCE3) TaxID=1008459 RepID=G4QAH5_TAYAM|nr:excinuclease ABC subunit UvrA [Taylorella asinigenitalis]AEP37206.1 Excinuclease ABC subunit A [Taylorella asinigenitalis MCE3]